MYDELVTRLHKRIALTTAGSPLQDDLEEATNAIEELSRRETPMRLRITTSTKRCPSCNKQVSGRGNIHGNYRYCRWCGQAIDWSEPPKEET